MATSRLRTGNGLAKPAHPLAIGWLIAIAAVVVMPSPVLAQTSQFTDYPASFDNCAGRFVEPASAPLSRLEQIRLAQSGVVSEPKIETAASSSASEKFDAGCDHSIAPQAEPITHQPTDFASDAILGSMSIAIAHTPFDGEWATVNSKRARAKLGRILTATGARRWGNQAGQIEAVNRWVNRNVAFGEDRNIYRRADYWAPASETFRRGAGDCEDFAIAKMELLSTLGIARDKMRLVVARDLVRNADHAVLVVSLADGAVMLDNMTDALLDARLPNDYRPIMSFSQNQKWLHGSVERPAPMVRMASAEAILPPVKSVFADVPTVTVEPVMPVFSMALLIVPLVLTEGLSATA